MNIKKELKNITGKEYCSINNLCYSVVIEKCNEKVYIPNYSNDIDIINTIDVLHPEVYIAELPNVNLLGATNIIFDDNNYCIYDLPFLDDENKFDLRYYSIYSIDKKSTLIDYNDSFTTIDEGIMLLAAGSYNFAHFNLELLTKLAVIDEFKEYNNFPLLIDKRLLSIPGFLDQLNLINKHDRKIIYLTEFYSYKIKKLIYISDLSIIPGNLKPGYNFKYSDVIMNPLSINLLHKSLAIKCKPYRKIFISRYHTQNLRLLNQTEIEELFKEFGYEIVYTEFLSLQEKIKLFSEAEFIAGVYGAGITNIIFADEKSTIICIQPRAMEISFFSNVAGILGQKYIAVDAELSSYTPYIYYQNSFTVNSNYLRERLNLLHN